MAGELPISQRMPAEAVGVVSVPSPYSVDDTVAKMKDVIAAKGLALFAHIDHGAGARQVKLEMQEAHVLIFGAAKAGTPLMVYTPLLALDLPLRVLVWEDTEKKVWVSYNKPEFLAQRYEIPSSLVKNISGVALLVKAAVA